MTAEFGSTSASEPHKMSGASSAVSTSGQKLSKFSTKSGFVIPKNKLSGSLVPIFRGAKKDGFTGVINEENSNQIERRSRWGPDLTQDTSVRRAKALALQIRVDQITKQLESEKPEIGDTQNSPVVDENPDESKSGSQINGKSERLELEKREAIGEILKLDPSYKPPAGFKPLLKEASIPLPVQEYPAYKFIGLILGPEGDNQKRLEKETGTKIKIHGTKADSGEKGEVKPGTDIQCSFKEMHVDISADSFDKVDAAVSIIEILIASVTVTVTVTGNADVGSTPSVSVSGDNTSVLSQSQGGPPSHAISRSLENHTLLQPAVNTQMYGNQFQYSGPWFSAVPSHTPLFTSSGNIVPPNPPVLARTPHFPSHTMSPSNIVAAFGAQPAPVAGFHPINSNQQVSMQAPPQTQILQHSQLIQASPFGHVGPPRNYSVNHAQNLPAPANTSHSFPINLSQPRPMGQLQTSASSMPQPMSGISPAQTANQPLTPHSMSSGLSGGPATVKMSVGLNHMGPMAPPTRPISLGPQPDGAFKPLQSNVSMMPRPATISPHHVGMPPGPPSSFGPMHPPIQAPAHSSGNHLSGPTPFPSPGISPSRPLPQQSGVPNSASAVSPHHTQVKPPVLMPSNSGNFTFHSQQPNPDYYQVASRPKFQATTQGGTQESPGGPRPTPYRFAVPDQSLQSFPRTQAHNRLDQTQAHVSGVRVPFGGRSGSVSIPPRHPAFQYAGQPAPRSPAPPQIGTNNFVSSPQMPNFPGPGFQRDMPNRTRPDIPMPLNQKFGNNPSGKPAHPVDQIYDPFSPTSVAPPQQ